MCFVVEFIFSNYYIAYSLQLNHEKDIKEHIDILKFRKEKTLY